MKSRIVTVLLIGLITVFAVHLAYRSAEGVQLDVTADHLYSLSPGTLQILHRMREEGVEPVTVRLYFSSTVGNTLPSFIKDFITYHRYLRTLLEQYARASDGRIHLDFIDPVPDSDQAQEASDLGLDGKPVNQHGDQFFFGLALQTRTGSREVIDFLWPEQQETIEYEITKRLHNLLWPSSQRIAVLSSLPVMGMADNPYLAQMLAAQGKRPQEKWLMMRLLEESYKVDKLGPEVDSIDPEKYDLVVIIHPKGVSEKTQWALDQWVERGGNLLVLVDPYSLEDQPPQNPQQPMMAYQYDPSSNLGMLLSAWGVERPEHEVAADLELGIRRPVRRTGPVEQVITDLGITEKTRSETLDPDHPALRGIDKLRFFLPGVLTLKPVDGVEATPLITTTKDGGSLEVESGFPSDDHLVFLDVNDPGKLIDRFAPGSEPPVLAYQLRGKLPSAFPDGPPASMKDSVDDGDGGEGAPQAVPEDQRKEATVVVVADTDFIADPIAFDQGMLGIVQAANDNNELFLNLVDYLLGSDALMQVRAQPSIHRPFTLFDTIEASAEAETREREKKLRADMEGFQEQLRQKQNEITQRNAALFQRKVQEEVDRLNEKIADANRELFEIRKSRRAALEREEARVRFAVLGWMPSLVLLLGIGLLVRRRTLERRAQRIEPRREGREEDRS
jgi:ABC-2 type transport system permease protein